MNAYTKVKRGDLGKTSSGIRCRLQLIATWPQPLRYAAVWPSLTRKSGFVVYRCDLDDQSSYLEDFETNSYRLARIAAKRFVEGRA